MNSMYHYPKLHVRRHAPFDDPERARVEEMVISRVESDPEPLFDAYKNLPGSMNGRYINSDLFKEIFPEYSASPAHRTVFNVPVHNSAAVLANELFHRQVKENADNKSRILFITGIPGAGKTTAVQNGAIDFNEYNIIYEGQLSNFDQAKEKIEFCISKKCEVDVIAFHRDPETALRNTFLRFNSQGRGASITAMSTIQGNLGDSFEKLQNQFFKTVTFCVVDLRTDSLTPICDKTTINILKSEGDTHAIRKRLESELELWRRTGRINEACYREAAGRSPFDLATVQALHESAQGNKRGTEGQPGSADGEREAPLVADPQAASIEARALENRQEQQALVDSSAAYDAKLHIFTQAKTEQAARLVDKLSRHIATQSDKVQAVLKSKPNILSSLWRGKAWQKTHSRAQQRLHVLESRLSRVKHFQRDTRRLEKLAEAKLRRAHKDLTRRRDAQLHDERARLIEAQQERIEQQRQQSRKTGRGRSLSREY